MPQPERPPTAPARTRILIAEDERGLAYGLETNLSFEGYDVEICSNGDDALQRIRASRPDLVVLDLMLPGLSGMDVLQAVRAEGSTVPIIVLSARTEETDIVAALRLGADDYVTKPFSLLELIARIALRLRPSQGSEGSCTDVVVDMERRLITLEGRPLSLAPKEFDLLATLITAGERVLSREELLRAVWSASHSSDTRTVDVHVGRIRRKLRPLGREACLQTVHAHGFRWATRVHDRMN